MSYNKRVWNNGDGLQIKFDVDQAEMINLGHYQGSDGKWVTEAEVELARLEAGANIISYNFKVKQGAYLHSAEVVVADAAVGGTSIEVGLWDTEGVTPIAADGLVTTQATAALTEGAVIAGGGSLIGAKATDNGIVVVTSAGVFTGGRVKVKLVWEVL